MKFNYSQKGQKINKNELSLCQIVRILANES